MSGHPALFVTIALIVTGAVIVGAAVTSTFSTISSTNTSQSVNTTTPIVKTTTQPIITPLPSSVSSTPLPNIGLSLHLTLNASVMSPDDVIEITFSDFNTLDLYNFLPRANNFSLPSVLDWWPCSGAFLYYAIFEGYYIVSNITGAIPLPQSAPGYLASCPLLNYEGLQFHPLSNIATVNGGTVSGRDITLWYSEAVPGYLSTTTQVLTNGSNYTLLHFKQGIYTVVVGDEWGDLAFAYFQIMG